MSTPALRCASRLGSPLLLAGVLPLLLAGCEAEAVELAQEISAARGDCTTEALRRSDEECVQMMERYTAMGTELVHTYIGGLKALDMALDRMPPVAFDTAGLGYAISPEFRAGDPFGEGASVRLVPTRADYDYAPVGPGAEYDRLPLQRGAARPTPRERQQAGRSGVRAGTAREVGPPPSREWRARDRNRGRGGRYYDRRRYEAFGYGAGDWWGYGDAYRYLESGPEGYFNSGPYAYFYNRPFGSRSGYGYDGYRDPYGYDPGYGYGSGYGSEYYDDYDYYDRYDPRVGYGGYGYGDYSPNGYPDPYGPGTQYEDPDGAAGRNDYRPYERGGGYGGYPYDPRYDTTPPDRPLGAGGRTPAEHPRYDAVDPQTEEYGGGYAEPAEPAASPAAAPQGPAPQRPGILLPPEERLWRPWLDD